MRNLKKLLAVIVAICVIATFTVPAFAADAAPALSADAQICKDLNVLEGDTDAGVTAAYLAKGTTRAQAAILTLRLMGKEAEAYAFTGTDNFTDGALTWKEGAAALAYLKAHPEMGWVGDGKTFNPTGAASAQMIYKVLLTALGYKEGTDFQYADTVTFAAGKGLKTIAAVTTLTNNDTATALVEGLKATLKDGTKTLAADLVAKNVISKASAEAAKLIATAVITAVAAIDATTITVTFDKAVTLTAANFKVADSAAKDMAISAATMADANTVVVLKVAAMTVGSKYTVTYGTTAKDVVPTIANDETKPALDSAVAVTGTMVRATFKTRNINKDTLVAANFTLDNDAKVSSVALDKVEMDKDANVGNTVVLLNVTGLKAGKAFTLKSSAVASYEAAVATDSKTTFAGKDADTTAPKLSGAVSVAGYQVDLTFDEAGIVNETGLNIANYTITPALAVTAAKWKKNSLGENIVTLTTADQKAGTAYTLSVDKISDGTTTMTAAATTVFAGQDKAKNQELVGAASTDATKVEVTLKYDANDTALAAANYTIDNSITVSKAEFKADTSITGGLDLKKVILTTSAMKAGVAYKLTVATGVQDILGQGLKEAASATFAGKDADTSFGSVDAESKDKNTVTVTFGEAVDRASCTTLANYSISDLGYPSSISLDSTDKIATLTVSTQTAGKPYTLTVNNLKDKAGNVVTANKTATFTGKGDVTTDVRVVSAVALSKTKIKVTFNQKLTDGTPLYSLTLSDGTAIAGITATGTLIGDASVDATLATDTNIVTVGGVDLSDAKVYKITVTTLGATGYLTAHTLNTDNDDATFVGSSESTVSFGIAGIIATDKTHVQVTFNEALAAGETAIPATAMSIFSDSGYSTAAKDASDAVIQNGAYVGAAPVFSTNRKVVTYELAKELKDSTVYYFQLDGLGTFDSADGVLAPFETGSSKSRTTFVTGSLSAASDFKLEITSVTMFDKNTLEVAFNTDYVAAAVNAPAAGVAVGPDGTTLDASDITIATAKDGAMITGVAVTKIQIAGDNKIRVYISGEDKMVASNGIYYLIINGATAGDLVTKVTGQGFKTDKNYASFAKNNPDNDVVSVALVEPQTSTLLKVTLSEKAFADANESPLTKANFVIKQAGANVIIAQADMKTLVIATGDNANKVFYVEIQNGVFLAGASYRIGLLNAVDESGLATDDYVVTSTDHSVQFGGTASALANTVTVLNTSTSEGGFTFSTPIYNAAGAAVASGAAAVGITETSVAQAVDTAIYTTPAPNVITVTLDGAALNGETIVLAAGYKDAAGNAIGAKTIKLVAGAWVLQ